MLDLMKEGIMEDRQLHELQADLLAIYKEIDKIRGLLFALKRDTAMAENLFFLHLILLGLILWRVW
jgi:hypothetical protein